MDGSKYLPPPGADGAGATRLALSVDREAVGLMKHASEISHMIDWWLQSRSEPITPLAAYRLGRKLERFRLSARLSEGRVSKPVQATLDALKGELAGYAVPPPLLDAIARAYSEAARLEAASSPPATIVRKAFSRDTGMGGPDPLLPAAAPMAEKDEDREDEPARPGSAVRWALPGLVVVAGAILAATDLGPQLLRLLAALLP
jgi:hypothetical protein